MSSMNPKQKRTWGTLLVAFGLILVPVAVWFTIYRWKTAPPPAILTFQMAWVGPIWFGTILRSQAKKEGGN